MGVGRVIILYGSTMTGSFFQQIVLFTEVAIIHSFILQQSPYKISQRDCKDMTWESLKMKLKEAWSTVIHKIEMLKLCQATMVAMWSLPSHHPGLRISDNGIVLSTLKRDFSTSFNMKIGNPKFSCSKNCLHGDAKFHQADNYLHLSV